MSADVCFLRFKNFNFLNKVVLKIEKASKLKDVEEEANKGVTVFADDTEVFRVLKMRVTEKKNVEGPQSAEQSGEK